MKFTHTCFGDTFNCVAVLVTYEDGQKALLIVDAEDGAPVATASVNLGGRGQAPEGYVWLKTWSENEGIEESLAEAGIVTLTPRKHPVNAHGDYAILAKLSEELLDPKAKSSQT